MHACKDACVPACMQAKTVHVAVLAGTDLTCVSPARVGSQLDTVSSLDLDPGGRRRLASGSWDAVVRVWDITALHLLAELRGHTDKVMACGH